MYTILFSTRDPKDEFSTTVQIFFTLNFNFSGEYGYFFEKKNVFETFFFGKCYTKYNKKQLTS